MSVAASAARSETRTLESIRRSSSRCSLVGFISDIWVLDRTVRRSIAMNSRKIVKGELHRIVAIRDFLLTASPTLGATPLELHCKPPWLDGLVWDSSTGYLKSQVQKCKHNKPLRD